MPKIKLKSDSRLIHYLIDVVFGNAFVNSLGTNAVNEDYISILIDCKEAEKEYFESKFDQVSDDKLQMYKEYLKNHESIYYCLKNLVKLKFDSDVVEFKLALNSIIDIKNIISTNPEAIKSVPNIFKTIHLVLCSLKYIATEFLCDNLIYISMIIFHSAIFIFKKSEEIDREIIAENIAFGLGHIILNSLIPPTELINEVLPRFEEILYLLKKYTLQTKQPILLGEMLAYIKFLYINPTEECLSIASQFCYDLILSYPLNKMGYLYIKGIQFMDTDLILKAGFMHFIKEYSDNHNPNPRDVYFLQDYFKFLKTSKILSKTEEIFIDKFLN